jgi:precorrin-6A/cobalt-precorrin-6A reductase
MCPQTAPTVRILAGTRAAVRLAAAAAARFDGRLTVACALCGLAEVPRGCQVDRIGPGLPALDGTRAVIDGLDPFDRGAIRLARDLALRARVPRLAFRPPVWHRHPLDRWIEVRDLAGAVAAAAAIARCVLLALPEADLAGFGSVEAGRFPVRLPRRPEHWAYPPRFIPHEIGRSPHHAADLRLLRATAAEAVVMRATGCESEGALVTAARALDLPIVMIRRPVERGELPARTVEVALDWIEATCSGIKAGRQGVPAWR